MDGAPVCTATCSLERVRWPFNHHSGSQSPQGQQRPPPRSVTGAAAGRAVGRAASEQRVEEMDDAWDAGGRGLGPACRSPWLFRPGHGALRARRGCGPRARDLGTPAV